MVGRSIASASVRVTLLLGLLTACTGVGAPPSERRSAMPAHDAAGPASDATPTLVPTPVHVSHEADGLRVELWLDRSTVRPGDRVNARARVTNVSADLVWWETNVCDGGAAPVTIRSATTDEGRGWSGGRARFKDMVVGSGAVFEGHFRSAATIDDVVACPAYSSVRRFQPGQTEEMDVAWDAVGRDGEPLLPGDAVVSATFRYWRGTREGLEDQPSVPNHAVSASTTATVVGAMPAGRRIVELVDIALADPRFGTLLDSVDPEEWMDGGITFWPNADGQFPPGPHYERAAGTVADVSVFLDGSEAETVGMVSIDVETGEILAVTIPE